MNCVWVSVLLSILWALPLGTGPARVSSSRKAPTIYIAADAEYGGIPSEIFVRGVTNLPPKSLLSIKIYDFIGEGARQLSVDTTVQVPVDGFFEATIAAAPGEKFRHNVVCDIVFMPRSSPRQYPSVLAVVGREGEFLGSPKNPQAYQHSGEYYLSEMVHVP